LDVVATAVLTPTTSLTGPVARSIWTAMATVVQPMQSKLMARAVLPSPIVPPDGSLFVW
jgi:hypothetical protein